MTRSYLSANPDEAADVAVMLAANVDYAQADSEDSGDASTVLLTAHDDFDAKSVVQKQQDALNDV